MKDKKWICVLLAGALLLTGGCSLLPAEEQAPEIQLVTEETGDGYTFTEVLRGEVKATYACSAYYAPTEAETLAFAEGGVPVVGIYVGIGDSVKPGDLLAELDTADMQDRLDDLEYQHRQYLLALSQMDDEYSFSVKKGELALAAMADPDEINQQKRVMAAAAETYALNRHILLLNMGKLEGSMEELRERIEARKLYAGMAGVVSFLSDVKLGDSSKAKASFITVSDASVSAFVIPAEYADRFPAGSDVLLRVRLADYTGRVADNAALGLEGDPCAYVIPSDPETEFAANDRATVTITLASVPDVLYVKSDAVRQYAGQAYVYVLDENGLRVMQNVETGLVGDNTTELVSGLDEGDLVILS